MDTLTPAERSRRMALIGPANSSAELTVRRLAHRLGYRYRIHVRELPGTPDLVFSARRKVVFVHGCFWHRHGTCALGRLPRSRKKFWTAKLEGNRERDARTRRKLRWLGWHSLVIWACQLGDIDRVAWRLIAFLEDDACP